MKTKPFIALIVLALFAWNTAVGQEYIEVTVMEVGVQGGEWKYFSMIDGIESKTISNEAKESWLGGLKPYIGEYKVVQMVTRTNDPEEVTPMLLKAITPEFRPFMKKSFITGQFRIYTLEKKQ